MNINLKATGIELTPAITEYTEKKVRSLEKFLPQPTDGYIARVEIGKTTQHHKEGPIFRAEVHITGGIDIYAATEAEDLYAAIDLMEADATNELQSVKGKRFHLLRKGQRALKDMMRGFNNRFKK